jgi:hypothetical protein
MRLFPQGDITLGPNESNPVWLTLTATRDRQPTRKIPGEINRATGEAILVILVPLSSPNRFLLVARRRSTPAPMFHLHCRPETITQNLRAMDGMWDGWAGEDGRGTPPLPPSPPLLPPGPLPAPPPLPQITSVPAFGGRRADAFMELPGARDRLALMRLRARRISMITLRRINGPGRFLMLASAFGAKVPDPLPL